MSIELTLTAIARGDAALETARQAIGEVLSEGTESAAHRAYRALRLWTWKALTARWLTDEMRGWHDLMASAETFLAPIQPSLAQRMGVLADLVEDSVRFAEANPDEDLLRRAHLPELLALLRQRNGSMSRSDLLAALAVGQATLSQLLTTLVSRGKLDRIPEGRNVRLVLTQAGHELADIAARALHAAPAAAPPLPVPPPAVRASRPTAAKAFKPTPVRTADPPEGDHTREMSRLLIKAARTDAARADDRADAPPRPALRKAPPPPSALPPRSDRAPLETAPRLPPTADQASRAFREDAGFQMGLA